MTVLNYNSCLWTVSLALLDGYSWNLKVWMSSIVTLNWEYKPQAVLALKKIAGLQQARVAHHRIHGPDTGSNSGGRQKTEKSCSEQFCSSQYVCHRITSSLCETWLIISIVDQSDIHILIVLSFKRRYHPSLNSKY